MTKAKRILTCGLLALALTAGLCACGSGGDSGNTGAQVTLSAEDQELIAAFGDDLQVVEPGDFASTVSALSGENVGQVYQLVGYYRTGSSEEDGEAADYLCSAAKNPDVSIQLRYLTAELTEGDRYTVTVIVAQEEHEDHSHIVLDVVAVESYLSESE